MRLTAGRGALGRFWAAVTATVPTAPHGGPPRDGRASPRSWSSPPRSGGSTRHVVTIAHEGAHGLVALAAGRRLSGIRLHSDTSGPHRLRRPPHGPRHGARPARPATPGPALFGLGAAALLAAGHAIGLLWALLALLALLLVQIRNWYGLWSVLVTGGRRVRRHLVAAAGRSGGLRRAGHLVPPARRAPRRSWSCRPPAGGGARRDSDADQLARLTAPSRPCSGSAFFLLVDVGALVLGGCWLLT